MTDLKQTGQTSYEAPRLTVIGSVHELTLGAQTGKADATLPKNPFS